MIADGMKELSEHLECRLCYDVPPWGVAMRKKTHLSSAVLCHPLYRVLCLLCNCVEMWLFVCTHTLSKPPQMVKHLSVYMTVPVLRVPEGAGWLVLRQWFSFQPALHHTHRGRHDFLLSPWAGNKGNPKGRKWGKLRASPHPPGL